MNTFNHRGFTLLELITVVIVIGLLTVSAMERILGIQVDVERTSMRQVLGSLQSAINLEAADRVLKHGLHSLIEMQNTNPMTYLDSKPASYRGHTALYRTKKDLEDASWYYDINDGTLVYHARHQSSFISNNSNKNWAAFRIAVSYRKQTQLPAGVQIEDIDHYGWDQ